MASPPNPADIRYGGFYLPVFSLLYVHQKIGLPVELPIPFLNIVLTSDHFPILIGITLFGALIGHGASRSIYGIDGAKRNPKNRWAVLWYRILFNIKKKPGKPPRTINDLEKKFENSIKRFWELSRGGKTLISVYRLGRLAVIWPAKLTFLGMVLLTTWLLASAAFEGILQPLGALLFVAQVVFFFGSWILDRFPTAIPVDAAPWLYLAEFHKTEHLHEQGDVKFEYGPPKFRQSAVDRFNEASRPIYDQPSYFDNEDVDWMVPIEDTQSQYVVSLDSENDEQN